MYVCQSETRQITKEKVLITAQKFSNIVHSKSLKVKNNIFWSFKFFLIIDVIAATTFSRMR